MTLARTPYARLSPADIGQVDRELKKLEQMSAGLYVPKTIVHARSPYTVQGTDTMLLCDCTAGAITLTFPLAARVEGMNVVVVKSDSSANAVTLSGTFSGAVNPQITVSHASYAVGALNGVYHVTSGVTNPVISGETGVVNMLYPRGDARRHGAFGDGVTDATTAVVAAITSLPTAGGDVLFPPGNYVINGDLSAVINTKRFVRFVGANGRTFRGNAFPPYPAATTLYLKNRTTYLFVLAASSLNEAFGLKDIAIDGSNGGGTANGSTTCPGVVANNSGGAFSFYFTAKNVVFTDISYSHSSLTGPTGRAVFDLDYSVLSLFEDCYFGYCQNGRLFFTDNGSTTFTARSCTFQNVREIYYHRNTLKALYDDCVFEASVVAGASYLSSVVHRACHYEALGANTGTAVWTTGLAPRNHGIGGGVGTLLSGNINTAIQQLYGSLVIESPTFNNLNDGPYTAWMECIGVGSATGVGGSLAIRDPRKDDAGLTDTLFSTTMAFTATERGTDFSVHLEDSWGTVPIGAVINKADDMRKCNSGRVRVHFNDGTNYMATIKRGRYWIELQEQSTSPTAAPTSYPRNDQNQVGDVIILPTPVAAGNIGLVCTTAGTPGTWKTFGAIAP